ncbi:MAG: helix-turn-helix domain-containing protein [Clostridia bacterium]|nr:helix-turn-helix domain-containing protein [Clostridia bacterium]
MNEIQGKHADLSISRPESLTRIARALSSELRVSVLAELSRRSLSVGELAKVLDVPMSSMAVAVKTLEEAGLIRCDYQPGTHGSLKICNRKLDTLSIELFDSEAMNEKEMVTIEMPIGGYSLAGDIEPTCGILNEQMPIGAMDLPRVFYSPRRFSAQLIWFSRGYLEYRFTTIGEWINEAEIEWVELSFEACSEAPMYRNPWPSDIYVEINGKRLGTWTCPCDCGGRQGHLTPAWWETTSTQFGFLKFWRVTGEGTYLDDQLLSNVSIRDLELGNLECVRVRIGVDPQSENVNGINLFGEKFGDHPQALVMKVGYKF